MFDISVCKDFHVAAEEFPISKALVGRPFDQSLIGYPGTRMNIDANELRGRSKSNGHCAFRIIAQYVNAKWQVKNAADFQRNCGHECNGMCRYPSGIERHVTKVLQDECIHATGGQGLSIL